MSRESLDEITSHDVPLIANGYRLQFEDAQDTWVLLYPEGMVKLNPSASEILQLCDGEASVESITRALELKFETNGLTDDVFAFLKIARDQHWIRFSSVSETSKNNAFGDDKET